MAHSQVYLRLLKIGRGSVYSVLLLLLIIFILPNYSRTSDLASLSVIKENNTKDAEVSGYSVKYVDSHGDDYDPNAEKFIATHEWKEIQQGQSIPRGLHVRMNLQTGVKEAKLLDEEDNGGSIEQSGNVEESTKRLVQIKENLEKSMNNLKRDLEKQKESENLAYWKEGGKQGMMNTGKKTFTKEELKEALKKFKIEREDDDAEHKKSVINKYRKIEDLKKDLAEMNAGIKSDVEIITELLETYKNRSLSIHKRLNILQDLEFYAHQIDNARDLISLGGIDLVAKDLNHSTAEVRGESAHVLGSASQSNPTVQVYLLKQDVLSTLLQLLAKESSISLRNRVIYALSSLLRQFPLAQMKFLQQGGLQILSNIFKQQGTEKLQLKVISLINDLVLEKKTSLLYVNSEDSQQKEKAEQYEKVLLTESINNENFCQHIPSLLNLQDHDTREKVMIAMTSLMDTCRVHFKSTMNSLSELKKEYSSLSKEEIAENSDDTYFTHVLEIVDNLIEKMKKSHDEL